MHQFLGSRAGFYLNGGKALNLGRITSNSNVKCFASSSRVMFAKKNSRESSKKTFKFESVMYDRLNTILNKEPMNEGTQTKIEEMLNDYSYIIHKEDIDSNSPMSLDYSNLGRKFSDLLIENKRSLLSIIDNFKEKNKKLNVGSIDELENNATFVISKTPNGYLLNAMFACLLRILSRRLVSIENLNSVVEVGCDLGLDIVRKYFYIMTSKIKEERNQPYYVSDWKRDNIDVVEKLENTDLYFKVGSILLG